jgi:pyrimidine deaminase RibD-like protein
MGATDVRLRAWHDPARHPVLRGGRDRRWLDRARRVAEGVDGKWRVGCVVVRSGRVLATAANSQRNDPRNLDGRLWLSSEHAEMAALRLAGNARGAVIYVARVGADGQVRHAQPCTRCRRALENAGLNIVWTSDPEYVDERRQLIPVVAG